MNQETTILGKFLDKSGLFNISLFSIKDINCDKKLVLMNLLIFNIRFVQSGSCPPDLGAMALNWLPTCSCYVLFFCLVIYVVSLDINFGHILILQFDFLLFFKHIYDLIFNFIRMYRQILKTEKYKIVNFC